MVSKPKIRLYVESELADGAGVTLTPPQSHYISHVMRCSEGQKVLVFNGRQGEWLASVGSIHKKHTGLDILQQLRTQTTSPDMCLVFAPVKNKTEVIIEKAVELGVRRIMPVLTQYTVVRSLNEERLQARIIEAAEQCGRLDLPVLQPLQELRSLLGAWDNDHPLLFADERGHGHPLKDILAADNTAIPALLVGPEGGFSEEEHTLLHKQPFIKPVSLGPRILRADTAAISALACLMAWQGDWQEQPCYPQLAAGSHTT
ncbi:MAG: 16S rRNA (uracil(1498)-N(3))-methyltransferase [Alphaproteobacteria bacterium]